MARANFNSSLKLPPPPEKTAKEPPGPSAEGPVPDGDELIWILVWIFQNTSGEEATKSAAAYGESSKDDGSPFSGPFKNTWTIETEMAHGSDDFTAGRPAQATAMALVKNQDGSSVVDWWSEPVMMIDHSEPGAPTA
jgi:hypothetical protein